VFHRAPRAAVPPTEFPLPSDIMKRYLFALTFAAAAVAAACFDVSSPLPPTLVLAPVLDSTFVGDTLPARSVFLYDANNHLQPPGHVTWAITPASVATIDTATGKISGVSKGPALISATVATAARSALALVFVSRPVDLTLLMDTVVVAPGDTISLPPLLAIKQKGTAATTLRFNPSPVPSVYTIDTMTGRITALAAGGPVPYVARLTAGTTTVADTGDVIVLGLVDTTSTGVFYMTVTGTAIRHQRGAAVGINYTRLNSPRGGFQLSDTLFRPDSVIEKVLVTLLDTVSAPGSFEIDSISPQEVTATRLTPFDAACVPPRPWAVWSSASLGLGARILAPAHGTSIGAMAGQLVITQRVAATGGGAIISGRYSFTAQRTDLYYDPLGAETIRGTFVAPVRTRANLCQG
jgi:hypothetical protein